MNDAAKRFNEAMNEQTEDKVISKFMDSALLLTKEISARGAKDPSSVTPVERQFMLDLVRFMLLS